MVNVTFVKIIEINQKGTVVSTIGGKKFTITSFDKRGVLNIEAEPTDMTLDEFREIVLGCFEEMSSFRDVVKINYTYNNLTFNAARKPMDDVEKFPVNRGNKKIEKKSKENDKQIINSKKPDMGFPVNRGNKNYAKKKIKKISDTFVLSYTGPRLELKISETVEKARLYKICYCQDGAELRADYCEYVYDNRWKSRCCSIETRIKRREDRKLQKRC